MFSPVSRRSLAVQEVGVQQCSSSEPKHFNLTIEICFFPMTSTSKSDVLLIERIRDGDSEAWGELISQYEGRLRAFVASRLSHRASSEDIVQETFIGLVNSLPNFDTRRSLESYLFSICAHKLTDHLRREGRRPTLPLSSMADESGSSWGLEGDVRGASSIVRSGERRHLEENSLIDALREQIQYWQKRGDWSKLKSIELLFVRGWPNKKVADEQGIAEQQVANFKFEFISRMRSIIKKQALSEDVFPELYEE